MWLPSRGPKVLACPGFLNNWLPQENSHGSVCRIGRVILKRHRSRVAAEPQTDLARAKCLSHPKAVTEAIRKHAADVVLVVFETGPLATWFHRKLTADGLPAVCIDARHAKAALDTAPNKTDANDADGGAIASQAIAEVWLFSPRQGSSGRSG